MRKIQDGGLLAAVNENTLRVEDGTKARCLSISAVYVVSF